MSIDSAILQSSAQRLFPDLDMDQILAELLLERAQKSLIKYRTMARRFEAKYGQDFDAFRQRIMASEPPSETEQDYFDWEMAVTGIADMEDEIARLERVQHQA
jgi:translation initiation factor 2 alpha subunit (eIF-2alpha)